jgi:hypothetical protein
MTYFPWIAVAFLVSFFFVQLRKMKRKNDAVYAKSLTEFHSSIDSILKTPEDLPDGVLDLIAAMNDRISASGKSFDHFKFRRLVMGKVRPSRSSRISDAELASMRVQLQKLLAKASLAWMSAMMHKSFLVGLMIEFETKKRRQACTEAELPSEKEAPLYVQSMIFRPAA